MFSSLNIRQVGLFSCCLRFWRIFDSCLIALKAVSSRKKLVKSGILTRDLQFWISWISFCSLFWLLSYFWACFDDHIPWKSVLEFDLSSAARDPQRNFMTQILLSFDSACSTCMFFIIWWNYMFFAWVQNINFVCERAFTFA